MVFRLRNLFNSRTPATKARSAPLMTVDDALRQMARTDSGSLPIKTLAPYDLNAVKALGFNQYINDFINDTGGRARYYDITILENAYRTSVYLFAALRRIAYLISTVPLVVEKRRGDIWEPMQDSTGLNSLLERDMPRVFYEGYMNYALHGGTVVYKRKTSRAAIAANRGEEGAYTVKNNGVAGLHIIPGYNYSLDVDYARGVVKGVFLGETDEEVGQTTYLKREEFVYLYDFDPREQFQGASIVSAAIHSAVTDAAIRQWASHYFTSGAMPLVLVSYDDGPGGFSSETDLLKNKAYLEKSWRGVNNSLRSVFLDRAVKVDQVGIEADKVAAPELSRTALEGISSAVGLAPDLIVPPEGGSDNARHKFLMKQVWTDTVLPLADQFVDALNEDLGLPDGWRIQVNRDEIAALDADRGEVAEQEIQIGQAGVQTLGEIRKALDMDSDDDIDGWWWVNGKWVSKERLLRADRVDVDVLNALATTWDNNLFTRGQIHDLLGLPLPPQAQDGYKFQVVIEGGGGASLGTELPPDEKPSPDEGGPKPPAPPTAPGDKPASGGNFGGGGFGGKEITPLKPADPDGYDGDEPIDRLMPARHETRPMRPAIKPPLDALKEDGAVLLPLAREVAEETGQDMQRLSVPDFRRGLEVELTRTNMPRERQSLVALTRTVMAALRDNPQAYAEQPAEAEVGHIQNRPLDTHLYRLQLVDTVTHALRANALPVPGSIPDRLLTLLSWGRDPGWIANEEQRESVINAVRLAVNDGWFDPDREFTVGDPLALYEAEAQGRAVQDNALAEVSAWEKVALRNYAKAVERFETLQLPDSLATDIKARLEGIAPADKTAIRGVFDWARQQAVAVAQTDAARDAAQQAAKAYGDFIAATGGDGHAAEQIYQSGVKALKAYSITEQNYRTNLYSLFQQPFDISPQTGKPAIDRNLFARNMRSLIDIHLKAAIEDGLEQQQTKWDDLDEETQAQLAAEIAQERKYANDLAIEIYKAVPVYREALALQDDAQVADSNEERAQLQQAALAKRRDFEALREAFTKRVDSWVNKGLRRMFQMGIMGAKANGRLYWHWFPPADHCKTCAAANGQIHRAKDWQKYGLHPGNHTLLCGGFNCKCRLEPTHEKARGKLDRIPLNVAGKAHEHDHEESLESMLKWVKALWADDEAMTKVWQEWEGTK